MMKTFKKFITNHFIISLLTLVSLIAIIVAGVAFKLNTNFYRETAHELNLLLSHTALGFSIMACIIAILEDHDKYIVLVINSIIAISATVLLFTSNLPGFYFRAATLGCIFATFSYSPTLIFRMISYCKLHKLNYNVCIPVSYQDDAPRSLEEPDEKGIAIKRIEKNKFELVTYLPKHNIIRPISIKTFSNFYTLG